MNSWRVFGIVVQSLVVGSLLFLAVAKLVSASTGAHVFQYEGF